MLSTLPTDLREAENRLHTSILNILEDNKEQRIKASLLFEGLRIMPVTIRLAEFLKLNNKDPLLIWTDIGSSSLAKRDYEDFTDKIFSLKEAKTNNLNSNIAIVTEPNHYDYELFEEFCNGFNGVIVMINGSLDDSAVGIGSVSRNRRKGFISLWKTAYWLQPLPQGALSLSYPSSWKLFRLDEDGYRYAKGFDKKPNGEEIDESLHN